MAASLPLIENEFTHLPLVFTAVIISNKEMEDIVKTVKYLEESGLLIRGVREKNN